MNKQEVISKLKSAIPKNNVDDYQRGEAAGLNFALLLLDELDEPQKPVVPQFVADWYEEYKGYFEYNLHSLCVDFHERKLQEDLHEWFNCLSNKPIETLVKMKLFGYEIEKEKEREKLYTVEIPNPNSAGGKLVLSKQQSTGRLILEMLNSDINKPKYLHLTEDEIKKDFGWAWQFAEEVEQCSQKH